MFLGSFTKIIAGSNTINAMIKICRYLITEKNLGIIIHLTRQKVKTNMGAMKIFGYTLTLGITNTQTL